MSVFFKKIFSTFLGLITAGNFLFGFWHRIPQQLKIARRQPKLENNQLYLEHAKAIDSDLNDAQLAHRSHSSHRSHRSHSSHRSHTSSSSSQTTSSYRNTSTSSSTYDRRNESNDAPKAENQDISVKMNTPISFDLKVHDNNGDRLVNLMVKAPKNGKLFIAGNIASYTPNKDYTGPDNFQYNSYDGRKYSNIATVQIVVSSGTPLTAEEEKSNEEIKNNSDTVLTVFEPKPQIVKVIRNAQREIDLSGNNPNAEHLKYVVREFPKKGKLTGKGPLMIYTPNRKYVGADSFIFVVSDGKIESSPARVTIFVIKKK